MASVKRRVCDLSHIKLPSVDKTTPQRKTRAWGTLKKSLVRTQRSNTNSLEHRWRQDRDQQSGGVEKVLGSKKDDESDGRAEESCGACDEEEQGGYSICEGFQEDEKG